MKITIGETGITAKDGYGNIFRLNALVIKKPQSSQDAYYLPHERFFQLACPPGTTHTAEVLPNGKVNIYFDAR